MYLDRDTVQQLYPARATTSRKQSVVKSGMREGGKKHCQFSHGAPSHKKTIFEVTPEVIQEEIEQLVGEKMRITQGKYFLNHWLSGFGNQICVPICGDIVLSRSLFFVAVKWKSRNITKHLMSGHEGNSFVFLRVYLLKSESQPKALLPNIPAIQILIFFYMS